jgi:hypothetical protein
MENGLEIRREIGKAKEARLSPCPGLSAHLARDRAPASPLPPPSPPGGPALSARPRAPPLLSLLCRTRLSGASLAHSHLRTGPACQPFPPFLAAIAPRACRAHVHEDRGHDREPRHNPPPLDGHLLLLLTSFRHIPQPIPLPFARSGLPKFAEERRHPCNCRASGAPPPSPMHLPHSEHHRPSVELLGRAPPRVRTANPCSLFSLPRPFSPPLSVVIGMRLGAVSRQGGEFPERSPPTDPPLTLAARRFRSWRFTPCACERRTEVVTPRTLGLASPALLLSLSPLSLWRVDPIGQVAPAPHPSLLTGGAPWPTCQYRVSCTQHRNRHSSAGPVPLGPFCQFALCPSHPLDPLAHGPNVSATRLALGPPVRRPLSACPHPRSLFLIWAVDRRSEGPYSPVPLRVAVLRKRPSGFREPTRRPEL